MTGGTLTTSRLDYAWRTALLVPRNLVIAFLIAYRAVISPTYGDVCKYHPTCSAYGLRAAQDFGVVRGAWLTVRRIGRCHPWARGGIDDVPDPGPRRRHLTRFGFVAADH